MDNLFTLDDSNRGALMLSQAMLGAVSANFRMVALTKNESSWQLKFYLEAESVEDREEIQEVAEEFEALQAIAIHYEVDIVVTKNEIKWPELPTRVVFRRREAIN